MAASRRRVIVTHRNRARWPVGPNRLVDCLALRNQIVESVTEAITLVATLVGNMMHSTKHKLLNSVSLVDGLRVCCGVQPTWVVSPRFRWFHPP